MTVPVVATTSAPRGTEVEPVCATVPVVATTSAPSGAVTEPVCATCPVADAVSPPKEPDDEPVWATVPVVAIESAPRAARTDATLPTMPVAVPTSEPRVTVADPVVPETAGRSASVMPAHASEATAVCSHVGHVTAPAVVISFVARPRATSPPTVVWAVNPCSEPDSRPSALSSSDPTMDSTHASFVTVVSPVGTHVDVAVADEVTAVTSCGVVVSTPLKTATARPRPPEVPAYAAGTIVDGADSVPSSFLIHTVT